MPWRRILSRSAFVLLFVLLMPLIVVLVVLLLAVFAILGLGLWLGSTAVVLWNALPRHRRAIQRAREALEARLPGRQASWHVARRDHRKCFVRATLTLVTNPRTVWLCAVWDDGRVDDLGTWQFHDGIGVRHAALAYDRAAAAGQPWPREMGELVQTMRPAAPPRTEPELRPHFGSVLISRPNGFSFYAYAVATTLGMEDLAGAEIYDAECRPLRLQREPHFAVLAPFPPLPPDKVFIVRLRHYLMGRADEETREQVRRMLPAELADHGIRTHDETGLIDTTIE